MKTMSPFGQAIDTGRLPILLSKNWRLLIITISSHITRTLDHRLSDSLLRVVGQGDPFLVLTEVQLHVDSHMPRRMRVYAGLAEEKYHLPVYPIW